MHTASLRSRLARPLQTTALAGLAAVATLGGLSAVSSPAEAEGPPAPATFAIDPVHSSITFEIAHLGVSHAWGRFNELEGSFVYDEADPSKSSVSLTVDAASVDTNNAKRDEHLRGPDFFTVKQFPKIEFESTGVRASDDGQLALTGELTFMGQTKDIESELTVVGAGDRGANFGYRAGFNTTFVVDRTAFGIDTYPDTLGKDVIVHVSLEGMRQ